MNKSFWVEKGSDGDPSFENPSRIEPKRSHQWFLDAAEPEFLPKKKQAMHVEAPSGNSCSGISDANVPSWDNTSGFQAVPNQFIHQLFGTETARSLNFVERNVCPAGTVNPNEAVGLSISHDLEDTNDCLSYDGFRKIKVNQVKDTENGMHLQKGLSFSNESNSVISTSQTFDRENGSSFITVEQGYDKEDDNVTLMGHDYNNREDVHIRAVGPTYIKGDDNTISINENYNKEDATMISLEGFHDIITVGRANSSYDQSYDHSSIQTSEALCQKELSTSNANAVAGNGRAVKLKPESLLKNKPEFKPSKKEAPNSFPSNVRSLISTGMLDGVPVKYVSLSREEFRGIIKGSGYLCGCQSCNYTKVLNAYEFERHAGCKTKHPNNHIYFENGKTIYQIVQELRSTPESMLFDVIQNVFGAPINQRSFRIWKESFQAATRELQRIYGKEELNL